MRTIGLLLWAAAAMGAPRFYADDPLEREPPPRSIEGLVDVQNRKLSDYFDLFSHQFGKPGERHPENGPPIRAQAVNTMGEPLQGAWWEKRHYYRSMSLEELRRMPTADDLPSIDGAWTVVSAKTEGVTPGFVILDSTGRRFFMKFDPITNPEMATSADAITSRLFYAMGYHVPENNIVTFDPEQLELAEDVSVEDRAGQSRPMTRKDLAEILLKAPKTSGGLYRATASLAVPGRPVGPPRYYGTRADDPNDIVPHEHRRDLRGLHPIAAWTAHDDSRAINNLDSVVTENGRTFIRHHMLDFGSTLGSGTQKANSPRSGAYFFDWSESAKQLFTFGLAPAYWAFGDYPNLPSVGLFEWEVFDPERWVPEYPNPAFLNRLPDDEFWGAKLVTAFTDEEIRAIVEMGQLSDKSAEDWLVECLIRRRDKIGKAYLAKLLPFDKFILREGHVAWEDLAAKLNYYPPAQVSLQWHSFNNETGAKAPISGAMSTQVPDVASGYTCLTIQSTSKDSHRIDVFLRHGDGEARIVGLERYW